MKSVAKASGIEINPKFVGAFFTERTDDKLRVFCFFTNGGISKFDLAVEENLENLQGFHSKLNMDETCSSVILDEVVQGRVYVRAEERCWLYTLLAAPGNVLPSFDGDISSLPWDYCWRSQAADVLEYGKPGDSAHCFAIRTQIAETDAARLVKDSKAFTNLVSVPKKKSVAGLYLVRSAGLVLLGTIIGLAAFYTFKQKASGSPPPVLASKATPASGEDAYYLLCNHQISGPYPVSVLASMNSGGLLNAETMCRTEQSSEWVSLAALWPSQVQK